MRPIPSAVFAVAALLLAASANALWADVAGQTFIIDMTFDTGATIKGHLQFLPPPVLGDALFGIDIENAGDITGTYEITTELFGGLITRFEATGSAPDDGYMTVFSGTAIDIKQLFSGTFLERFVADIPATISGSGQNTNDDGDVFDFEFEGEELLVITTTTTEDTPGDEPAEAPAPERSPRRGR